MKTTKKPKSKTIQTTITLDIDWSESPSFRDIEKEALKKIEQAKKDLLKQILTTHEDIVLPKPRYDRRERRQKMFQTILGEIKYDRYKVYDRKLKKVSYPLDRWLGIEDHKKICGLLKDEILRLTVDCPFRFAAKEISHWTGVHLTKDLVWAVSQESGQLAWEQKNKVRRWQRHEPLPKQNEVQAIDKTSQPAQILCIGLDGTYVKRQENKRRVRTKHDVKVAVLYTGKERIHGDVTLTNRQTVIQSRSENLDSFLGRVVAKAIEHYGLNENTTVLLFGDGDMWIKKFKDYVPQAHYRLDPWHVFEKIKLALNLTEIPKKWIRLIYGKPEALIAEIKTLQTSLKHDPTTSHQKIDDLIRYLKNNKEGLMPWTVSKDLQKNHRALFKWGSGHVESQIEIAVYDRHKLNRMSWSQKGLHNLSTLRENKLNQHKKPNFTCSKPPIPIKINLGYLNSLILPPSI